MHTETKRVLVTVKAYPNPSRKYVETVCVAGIDFDTAKWIRLHPIQFRDLNLERRFKKYAVIQVEVTKGRKDKRPESYKVVNADRIKILGNVDTKNKWAKRKEMVLPTVSHSMCEVLDQSKKENRSLGAFKPRDVKFLCEKARKKDLVKRAIPYLQGYFWRREKKPIEAIPFDFRYEFYCYDEPSCPGHNCSIIDWEIMELYRKCRDRYPSQDELIQKIEERWLTIMCSPKRDVYFFIGNMWQHPDTFMILGVFYPPK